MARMVTSSRRAGRVTNKTKLLIYRGSDKVDLAAAETIVWENDPSGSDAAKHHHVGAKGVESGELLVSRPVSFTFSYAWRRVLKAVRRQKTLCHHRKTHPPLPIRAGKGGRCGLFDSCHAGRDEGKNPLLPLAVFTRILLHQSSVHPTHSFEHHAPRCMGRSMPLKTRPHACVFVEVEGGHRLEDTSRSTSFPIGKVVVGGAVACCVALLRGSIDSPISLTSTVPTYTWPRNIISKQRSHPPHSCTLDLPPNLHHPPLPANPNRLRQPLLLPPPQQPPHSTTTSLLRTRRA